MCIKTVQIIRLLTIQLSSDQLISIQGGENIPKNPPVSLKDAGAEIYQIPNCNFTPRRSYH